MIQRSFFHSILAAIFLLLGGGVAHACQGQGGILDAETERLLNQYSLPLLDTSGLGSASISVILSGLDDVNAYASPGCVVLYSGLLFEAETPAELRGVIAHEIGHLAGGHITTLRQQYEEFSLISLASTILGLGIMIAGLPDAGLLVVTGGTGLGVGRFLQHSRAQEASADNAALTFLEQTGRSGRGLINFFTKLADIERDYASDINPYMTTHPLSQTRIAYLKNRVERSPYAEREASEEEQLAYDMVRAKLFGFLRSPDETLRRYPPSDLSMPARYARTVMMTRIKDYEGALVSIEEMIRENPARPFLHEWRGYIQTNNGRIDEAVKSYEEALRLAPNDLILHLEIGLALTAASDEPELTARGIIHLKQATEKQGQTAGLAWRQLARAYDLLGHRGMAELATAESAYIHRNYFDAITHAGRARNALPADDRYARIRAEDLHIISCNALSQQGGEGLPKELVQLHESLCLNRKPRPSRSSING